MLFGIVVIVGIFVLLVYMVGHAINIIQRVVDGQKAFNRSKTKCPYCGVIGHGKEYHVPRSE